MSSPNATSSPAVAQNESVGLKFNPNFVLETPEPVVGADLSGRVVVVLGANVGLGFEASKHFARMGPEKLIMVCRNETKGNEAVEDLKQATGFDAVELRIIDLSNFASVCDFATKYTKEVGKLDVLVANAAMLPASYESTVDGWEMSLQVNYLSIALSTLLLLPVMIETAKEAKYKPRVVVVSSSMHEQTTLDEKVIDATSILQQMNDGEYCKNFDIMKRRYSDTKLFGVFFVRELSERLTRSGSPLIVNVVDPGRCESQLSRNLPLQVKQQIMAMNLQRYTTEEGSRALVYGAVGEIGSDNEDDLKGAHIRRTRRIKYGEFVTGEIGKQLQKRIWDEMSAILYKVEPRVTDVVTNSLG
ncbi:NAD(P)-binding protein [Dendrothele bispora CBS 962.96]|uniref:NAD(P)-binding protein n=1 Tax=Dendrothele bispora (strain CBS 962.96) TaxID=1314807 RepID=A0A4S8LBD4_DENBC|nr:NAD(P)-binding protein [Dendrothele bispora CBS 962.96]